MQYFSHPFLSNHVCLMIDLCYEIYTPTPIYYQPGKENLNIGTDNNILANTTTEYCRSAEEKEPTFVGM